MLHECSNGWCFPSDDEKDEGCFLETSDTVELSRRLLHILSKSDPVEAEEELKKLREELNARSEWYFARTVSLDSNGL